MRLSTARQPPEAIYVPGLRRKSGLRGGAPSDFSFFHIDCVTKLRSERVILGTKSSRSWRQCLVETARDEPVIAKRCSARPRPTTPAQLSCDKVAPPRPFLPGRQTGGSRTDRPFSLYPVIELFSSAAVKARPAVTTPLYHPPCSLVNDLPGQSSGEAGRGGERTVAVIAGGVQPRPGD